MIVEVTEKTRSRFRANEILFVLWELNHVFYMVRIVWSWAITFMLQVFVFEHVCRSYQFEHGARVFLFQGHGRSGNGMGLACFSYWHPLFTSYTPLAHCFYFFIFSISIFIFWLYLFFLNIKNHQKYFLNFYIFILLFLLFFGHINSLLNNIYFYFLKINS